MKGSRLLSLAAAVIVSAPSIATAAFAGDPNIDKHFYHGRQHVQVFPDGPLVTIFQDPQQQHQTYVIEAPTVNEPAPPPQMIRPSGNAPTIVEMGLPRAGFESQMISQHPRRLSLPSGASTNLLAGRMLGQAKPSGVPAGAHALINSSKPASIAKPSQPGTMIYRAEPASSGMGSINVKTEVSGQLKRGSMLSGHR